MKLFKKKQKNQIFKYKHKKHKTREKSAWFRFTSIAETICETEQCLFEEPYHCKMVKQKNMWCTKSTQKKEFINHSLTNLGHLILSKSVVECLFSESLRFTHCKSRTVRKATWRSLTICSTIRTMPKLVAAISFSKRSKILTSSSTWRGWLRGSLVAGTE